MGDDNLKNLPDHVLRFTLLAGNLLLEGSKKENFVFSPLNIFHAFSSLHKRSLGATRDELCSIFGFPDHLENTSHNEFHIQLAEFLKLLSRSRDITLNSTNGMLTQFESHITAAVSESGRPIFHRTVSNILTSPAITTDCINYLVSFVTNGKIRTMFPKISNTRDKLLIFSALHFTGQLESEFPKSMKKETFETRFSNINVDMMSHQQYVQYLDDPKFSFRILGLPYKNGDFSMYIQLPREDPKSTNFLNNFDAVYSSSFVDLSSLKKRLVYYKIPRFYVATTSDLEDVFVKFGSHNLATLPTLDDVQEGPDVVFADFKHGASFEFAETKVRANEWQSSGSTSTPPIKFFVNKPFTFFVHYHPKKCILLSGAISKPLS